MSPIWHYIRFISHWDFHDRYILLDIVFFVGQVLLDVFFSEESRLYLPIIIIAWGSRKQ